MVNNLPANAGDTGSIPGPGRPHMLRGNEVHETQLLKPAHLEPVLCNKRSHRHEQPTCGHEVWPTPAKTRAKPVQQQRCCMAINKQIL